MVFVSFPAVVFKRVSILLVAIARYVYLESHLLVVETELVIRVSAWFENTAI